MNPLKFLEPDFDIALSELPLSLESLRDKKIFMTGGTGFIGKWILGSILRANELNDLKCCVTVLSRNPERFLDMHSGSFRSQHVSFVKGDLLDLKPTRNEYQYFIHGATDVAQTASPIGTFDCCSQGTLRALEFARASKVQRFLLLSSGAVYGNIPKLTQDISERDPISLDLLHSQSAYSIGKISAEWLASQFSFAEEMSVTIARCFAFVGPFLPMNGPFAIGNFIQDALAGRAILIKGDGLHLRSYLYASDMAAWLLTILLKGKSRSAYNVGSQNAHSILEVAKTVARVLGSSAGVEVMNTGKTGLAAARYIPSTLLAQTELQLRERIGLEQAIIRTAMFVKEVN